MSRIKVAIVGFGSVASNLIQNLAYYCKEGATHGLIIPTIFDYGIKDLSFDLFFDVNKNKVNKTVNDCLNANENIYVKRHDVSEKDVVKIAKGNVLRGPTLDGLDLNLRKNIVESNEKPVHVSKELQDNGIDVLINLLPTGSKLATSFYSTEALNAGVAFINANPTEIFRNKKIRSDFLNHKIPLLGDDIKSQVGTTILHRAILSYLKLRGATIENTTQINMGGNMDFYNLEKRSKTKIKSKKNSVSKFINPDNFFIKNMYNSTKGPIKQAYIDASVRVFGGSPINLTLIFSSDDKANASGCLVDLIRFSKCFIDQRINLSYENLNTISAFYMKSPLEQEEDFKSYSKICRLIKNEKS